MLTATPVEPSSFSHRPPAHAIVGMDSEQIPGHLHLHYAEDNKLLFGDAALLRLVSPLLSDLR